MLRLNCRLIKARGEEIDRIICALDIADRKARLVEGLDSRIKFFKVGSCFDRRREMVKWISTGNRVFLDLKFYDMRIPLPG